MQITNEEKVEIQTGRRLNMVMRDRLRFRDLVAC